MKQNKVLIAAIFGNILEYYDFTVFTVFIGAIGRNFFSHYSELSQTLASLAVFAIGFITRPIGGILFGYIGDRFGRKIALILSMIGMTIPTILMGILPGFDELGIAAPAFLIFLRLVQGLCISGEGAGAAIFVLEHHHNLRPGLVTALVHASNIVGTLIASCVAIIIEYLYPDHSESWRLAFMLGGIFGLVGLYLRMKVSETPIFQEVANKKRSLKSPLKQVIKNSWRSMIVTFFCGGITSSIVYLVKTYLQVFYSNILQLDNKIALFYLSYSSCILMISMPLFGFLSDIFNRTKVMVGATSAALVFVIPILILMAASHPYQQILGLTALGMLAGSISGNSYLFVISLFRPEERFSGVAISYNLGIAVFGGTSAIVARYLVEVTGLFYAPGFYIIATSSMFLAVVFLMRKKLKWA